MLRSLRVRLVRAPRIIAAFGLLAFAAPAIAGPLAFCLQGDETPRVVAAAAHCEMMVDAAGGLHLPAVDDAAPAAFAAPTASAATAVPLLLRFGDLLPAAADLLPQLRGAYGGAARHPWSSRSFAVTTAGESVRLLI